MPAEQSPDVRCQLEVALEELACLLRTDPTLPADPSNSQQPLAAALREDMAVQLPLKHCDFRGCQYSCNSDHELLHHLENSHRQELRKVASLTPAQHSEVDKLVGVYNEVISVVVRQGAPLASYEIDRRCLYNYMRAVADDNIEALICFCCARRYPHLKTRGLKHHSSF